MNNFKVKHISLVRRGGGKKSSARIAELKTNHGKIQTPFFMPIATVGAVKTLSTQDVKELGAQIILSNTYHLLLRPGMELMKKVGGLHNFMDWPGPILTDSGGFQVYSLAKIRKVTDKGVTFRSHIDGKEFIITPKKALEIQSTIHSDIAMLLDECVGYPVKREEIEKAVNRTTLWAKKSQKTKKQKNKKATQNQLHFAINQGGVHKDLRLKSARGLVKLNFDGYAIGGLAVGEPWAKALKVLKWVIPELPENKPRYLMGVGYPEQIVEAVKRGVDMFDCVIPTREARHGKLYAWKKDSLSGVFYQTANILNSKFTCDFSPISKNSKFPELQKYSKSYLHHLFKIKEPLAQRLSTLNNLEFYLGLMQRIRNEIKQGKI